MLGRLEPPGQGPCLFVRRHRPGQVTRVPLQGAGGEQAVRQVESRLGIGRRPRRKLPPYRDRLLIHVQRLLLVADVAGERGQLVIRRGQGCSRLRVGVARQQSLHFTVEVGGARAAVWSAVRRTVFP